MSDTNLLDLIPRGRENAIPMKDLARLMDYEPRAVRRLVFDERRRGVPICSTTDNIDGGYYLPSDENEAATYIKEQKSRIKSAQIALQSVLDYVQEVRVDNE
jgi:hypothetical protein